MGHLLVWGIAFAMAIVAMAAHCFYFPGRITLDITPEPDNIDATDQDNDRE